MADYLILIPSRDEFTAFVEAFPMEPVEKKVVEGFAVNVYSSKRNSIITVAECGMGKVACASVTANALSTIVGKGDCALLVGTAASATPGNFFIYDAHNDVDVRPIGSPLGKIPKQPASLCSNPKHKSFFYDLGFKAGSSLTGDMFFESLPNLNDYDAETKYHLVDMEDYAFLYAASFSEVESIVLRSVSDAGDANDWQDSVNGAMTKLADAVYKFITSRR